MKSFLQLIIVFSFCFSVHIVSAQSNCNKSNISAEDKKLFEDFWTHFKIAVDANDKEALSSLIKFSFNCDYCVVDTNKESKREFIKISKKMFDQNQYQIFFDPKLKNTISKESSLVNALIIINNKDGLCSYSFGYASINPSKDSEGEQHFFTLEKVHGKFVITSAFSIP